MLDLKTLTLLGVNPMNIIINEYKIDGQKLCIEHNIVTDNYYFRIIDPMTFKLVYQSEPISDLIPCRAKAFEYLGVQA
jgi:hypothetical protein